MNPYSKFEVFLLTHVIIGFIIVSIQSVFQAQIFYPQKVITWVVIESLALFVVWWHFLPTEVIEEEDADNDDSK